MAIEVKATDFGKALLVKALNNTCPILFTGMKFGNGNPPADFSVLTDLVNPVLARPITGVSTGDNYIQLSATFSNSDVPNYFDLTEIGVFAMDQDGVTITQSVTGTGITAATVNHIIFMSNVNCAAGTYEFSYNGSAWKLSGNTVSLSTYGISVTGTPVNGDKVTVVVTIANNGQNLGTHMFAYLNQADDPEPIYGVNSSKLKENTFSVVIVVDDAENVTAMVKSLSYVTNETFDEHATNVSNPHQVTKAQVGLSDVPNVNTNNQTPTFARAGTIADLSSGETLSTLLGKISKAVNSLISHLSNVANPHNVTAAQVGAAETAHTHAASAIVSGVIGTARGGTGRSSYTANTVLYASGASAIGQVSKPSESSYLRQDASGAPYFAALSTLTLYQVGNTAPTNTNVLWIDTTPVTGGLKYHNGTSWELVPVGYNN